MLFRSPRSLGQSADISRPNLAVEPKVAGDFFDKSGIAARCSPAQLMIKMADDQFLVAKINQEIQKRDGIAATGNADEVAAGRRKVAEESFGFN